MAMHMRKKKKKPKYCSNHNLNPQANLSFTAGMIIFYLSLFPVKMPQEQCNYLSQYKTNHEWDSTHIKKINKNWFAELIGQI